MDKQKGVPTVFFVNKIDDPRGNYERTLEEMKEKFGKAITPFVYPIREGEEFKGFVDIVDMTARRYEGEYRIEIPVPEGMAETIAPLRDMIMEAIAETDEDLMMKYLEGEEITVDELKAALRKATINNEIVPMLCGTSYRNKGVQLLLDAIIDYMPAPIDVPAITGINPDTEQEETRPSSDEEPSDTSGLTFWSVLSFC